MKLWLTGEQAKKEPHVHEWRMWERKTVEVAYFQTGKNEGYKYLKQDLQERSCWECGRIEQVLLHGHLPEKKESV